MLNHHYAVNPKNRRPSEENLETRKRIENPDLGAKSQVWCHWPNHFESTKKLT